MRKLIVISSENCFEGELEVVNCLFDAGLERFHLRKPGISLESYGDFLKGIDMVFYDRIVMHQFHEYGPDWGVTQFHYSEVNRESMRNAGFSTSIHDLSDWNKINGFHYSFFGPVFNSLSKPGYSGTLDLDFKLPRHMQNKLVALGGITVENIAHVFEMGFDNAAVLGTIWSNPSNALQVFRQLQDKCKLAEV